MALLEVIEFLDETGKHIIHRIPEHGSGEIRLGSQCVVRESQVAVFFRGGQSLDVLGPGTHTLTTANIPILVNLIKLPFGSKSPFRAEVVFVNMREFVDMKWGTPQMIPYRDSDFGIVRLRGHGTYAIQVDDPQLFVNKIAGTQGIYTTDRIEDYLRSMIVSKLADLIGENLTSVLDLAGQYDELSGAIRVKLADDFANVGMVLKAFYITAITVPEEVERAIDERAQMGAIGDMNAYLRFKSARAIGDAATAEGAGGLTGALVAGAAGLGLGGAVAGQAIQGMQPGAPAASGSEALLQQLENLRAQGVLSEEEYQKKRQEVLSRSGQGPSIPDQIKQLAELRDQGILTEEEFQQKKQELLSRL
ncbi:MAG: SPFH domain-containing protein [Chloroflexia bacterium]|nr:SPFH domain-containing protein [Chloroflexia bacterium]